MKSYRFAVAASLLSLHAAAATLEVGPGKMYPAPCAAIAAAAAGDTITIDAAGTYAGDVCGWITDRLTLVGVNGRPKIDAAGKSSGGKAIWVIGGADTVVDNVELTGCQVVDKNGAGIRQEGRNLTVRRSRFHDNEDGILSGDGGTITIEYSEFDHNGAGDGYSHNLYIGHADLLIFRYNYSHHAKVGHLLKSRARVNRIEYNRLSDEGDGTASYEVNLPSAGTAYLIGNVIEQGPMTQNPAIIDYGSEPNTLNPATDLYVINNTVVNDLARGTFVQIGGSIATAAQVVNNIFVGGGTITTQGNAVQASNYSGAAPLFVAPASYDYHLQKGSPAVDAGKDPGMANGVALAPVAEYAHPASGEARVAVGPIDVGAYELGGGMAFSDGGGAVGDGGKAGGDGAAMVGDGGKSGGDAGATGSGAGGCSCAVGGRGGNGPALLLGLMALARLMTRRRR